MSNINMKAALPYVGIPVIIAAVIILGINRLDSFIILIHCLLVLFSYIAAVSDIKSKTIPNSYIVAMAAGWVLVTIPQLFFNTEAMLMFIRDSLTGFIVGSVLTLAVYLISRKGLGGGDVKFIALVGLYIGLDGVLPSLLIGSVLAGLTAVVLILLKKIGRKDAIPLAPFLFAGILVTIFFM